MPSSGFKDQRQCFANLRGIFEEGLPDGGVDLDFLVLEAITKYEVSERSVRQFIQHFFLDRGLVELRDGLLYPVVKAVPASEVSS